MEEVEGRRGGGEEGRGGMQLVFGMAGPAKQVNI